jgi:NADPH:quinone reductase-like Zn-dependent oxidoreductase
LNPVDWKAAKYPLPFLTDFPAVLGTDSAGTITAVGEGVSNFQVGDKVYVVRNYDLTASADGQPNSFHQGYFTNPLATFQQYVLNPADITAKVWLGVAICNSNHH